MSSGILQSGFRPPVLATGAPYGVQPPFNPSNPFGISGPASTRGFVGGAPVGAGFSSFIGGSAFGDADPITPGIQAQQGTLTVTGPSTFTNAGYGGVGVGAAGFGTNVGGYNYGGGVVDADPFTPGIQSQPGVVTAVGPPRVVGGPGYGIGGGRISGGFASGVGGVVNSAAGFNRGFGGVVDADPFTPGIQSQPGVVTAVGPSRVVGGPGYAVGGNAGGFGGMQTSMMGTVNRGAAGFGGQVFDADPITPGIQAQPGVVTAVGAPRVVGTTGSGISNTFGAIGGAIGGAISGAVGAIGGALGITSSGRGQPIYDADPITPGIQATAGTVTATGPSVVVGQTGGVNVSGYRSSGQVYDADPFTPGIQAQPGMLTSVNIGGGFGGIVDADPFTPGIQAQPGTVTITGPTTTVSGGFQQGYQTYQTGMSGSIGNVGILNSGVGFNRTVGGGVDLDPITPGYQTGPGLVTQTGPSRIVGRVGQSCFDCCPWWLWTLLGLLLLGALLGGLYSCFKPKADSTEVNTDDETTTTITKKEDRNTKNKDEEEGGTIAGTDDDDKNKPTPNTKNETIIDKPEEPETIEPTNTKNETTTTTATKTECKNGHINSEGKCIVCPEGSTWNGKTCSYNKTESTAKVTKVTVGAVDGQTPEGDELDNSIKVGKGESESGSKAKTVPVFVKVSGEQEINGAIKNNKQDEGTKPQVITSKPTTMKPSVTIDAKGNVESGDSDVVSNNIVTVPATFKTKSVAPTMVTKTLECKLTGAGCLRSEPYLGYGNTGLYSIKSSSSSSSSSTTSGSTGSSSTGSNTGSGETTSTTTTTDTTGSGAGATGAAETGSSSSSTDTSGSSTGSSGSSSETSTSSSTNAGAGADAGESGSNGSDSTTTTKRGSKTTTRTTVKEEVVDPIISDPSHKHMRRA